MSDNGIMELNFERDVHPHTITQIKEYSKWLTTLNAESVRKLVERLIGYFLCGGSLFYCENWSTVCPSFKYGHTDTSLNESDFNNRRLNRHVLIIFRKFKFSNSYNCSKPSLGWLFRPIIGCRINSLNESACFFAFPFL